MIKELILVRKTLKERIKDNPLQFYWPHAYGCDGKSCAANAHTHTDYYGESYTITGCPQYAFHIAMSPINTYALFGANRCIDGKTAIFDPVANKNRIVKDIKKPFFVYAWNGERLVVARAQTPFLKGYGALYRIELEDGKNLTVSPKHRVLTQEGFVEVGLLHEGSEICTPSCIDHNVLDTCLQSYGSHLEDTLQFLGASDISQKGRLIRLLAGSLYKVQDNQIQSIYGESRSSSLFLQKSNEESCRLTRVSSVRNYERIKSDSLFYYQTLYRFCDEQLRRFVVFVQDVAPLLGGVHECIFCDPHELKYNQTYQLNDHLSIEDGQLRHCILPDDVIPSSETSKIKSIKFVKYGFYYDFTVPLYHNYQDVSTIISSNSGKTTSGVIEDAFHATGLYPDWYPKEKQWTKPTRGRIFGQDFRVVNEVITPEINRWFPKATIKDKDRNNQGVYTKYYIKHVSGGISTFDILTYEMDSSQCESWYGHWVHWDEPPPRAHRTATVRGLTDYGGYEYFSLTPLKEPWIFDEVYQNEDVVNVTCDIRHNLLRLNPLTGLNIGLPGKNISITESKWTQEEIAARGRGKFRFLAGRIWKHWEREAQSFDRFEMWKEGERGVLIDGQPSRNWKRVQIIDPHDRQPHALLWVAQDPEDGRMFAYREAWLADMDFPEVVSYIMNKELEFREKIDYRLMDPNFGPKMQGNTRQTVRQTFEREAESQNYPMQFSFGDDHKELGRKAVSDLLRYNKNEAISIINRPQLMIAKDLVQCIYQIEHYVWADYKFGERDPKEKPKDLNTHFPDILQYLGLFKWEAMDAEVDEGVGSFYNT